MRGFIWKGLPGPWTRGDWQSNLIALSQLMIGGVALVALLAALTRAPLLLLGFTAVQLLILLGVILFVVVALFAQRTLVLQHFGPHEVVFAEGDEGRHVYVIKTGTVEVLRKRPDGSPEVIKQLGPGDHFGEMALLRNAPRVATIRTVTETDVFKMSPTHFAALYTNLEGFREQFKDLMEARLREIDVKR